MAAVAAALVTLTSDFGTADGYVGAMKGVLLSRAPGVSLVDVSHDIPPHDVAAGARCLATAVPWFPSGTIHLAVVDPGVGGPRMPVVVVAGGHLFVGPDNGLFSLLAQRPDAAFRIEAAGFQAGAVAPTFHGRDLFAVAAARLATGAAPAEVGPAVLLAGRLATVAGHSVVQVDRFGNLVTDLPAAQVALGIAIEIDDRQVARVHRTYSDVAPGELLAHVGSGGTVEIAVREGSAARVLGVGRGARVAIAGAIAVAIDRGEPR